jgi:hypothetical protein
VAEVADRLVGRVGPVRRVGRLSPSERRIVCTAVVALPLAVLALAVIDFRRLLAALPRRDTRIARLGVAPQRVIALVASVASFLPGRPSCLPQSLVAAGLLARAGYPCRVVIGARRRDATLESHAWVEVDGRPAEPRSAEPWTPLVRWPAADLA